MKSDQKMRWTDTSDGKRDVTNIVAMLRNNEYVAQADMVSDYSRLKILPRGKKWLEGGNTAPLHERGVSSPTFAKCMGVAIRLTREKKKIKRATLADMLGVVENTVGEWEQGHYCISLTMLFDVGRALEEPAWRLFQAAENVMRATEKRLTPQTQEG
jgi:DNA-binding XRE family transcriptional regulator